MKAYRLVSGLGVSACRRLDWDQWLPPPAVSLCVSAVIGALSWEKSGVVGISVGIVSGAQCFPVET